MLRRLLARPLARSLDLDAPGTTARRRAIIREKPVLQRVYDEWYRLLVDHLPTGCRGQSWNSGQAQVFWPN